MAEEQILKSLPILQDCNTIPLAGGMIALVSSEDWRWLSDFRWHSRCGHKPSELFYAVANNGCDGTGKRMRPLRLIMHKMIMQRRLRKRSVGPIDHKNCDGLDNRRENLRLGSPSENQMNARKRKGASSKFKGVYFQSETQSWMARIVKGSRTMYLGLFGDEAEAAMAYNEAAIRLFGEFARINEIKE